MPFCGKKRATIYIEEEVHTAAKALGLNISAACEGCLRDLVEALKALKEKV